MPFDDDSDFVPIEECAKRMGLTTQEIVNLVNRRVLRHNRFGNVQPAIISGISLR